MKRVVLTFAFFFVTLPAMMGDEASGPAGCSCGPKGAGGAEGEGEGE